MKDLVKHISALEGPILVLGAAGFVGSNVFLEILKSRNDVFGTIHSSKNWRIKGVDQGNLISVDLNDYSSVKNMISKIKPKTVFDLATYGAYSYENNSNLIYKTNFTSKQFLIDFLIEKKLNVYVHAGSSSEYGTNSAAPLEKSATEPNSDYAVSKIAISKYLNYLGKHKGFPCLNLRLYSVYGFFEDESRLIPNLLKHVAIGKLPPLVNSEVSRDFIFVSDVVEAFIKAGTKINPDIYGENVNIGTGIKTSIRELIEMVSKDYNLSVNPTYGNMKNRHWDLTDWYSNSEYAKQILDWEAKTSLSEGLSQTMKWLSANPYSEISGYSLENNLENKSGITAVVACYKDADAIPIMYERLKSTFNRIGIEHEIIFVNDGSPDNSTDVITKISASDSNVIGVQHSRNFGSQMAFRSGMELSTKDAVVLLDGDLQDPPELIEEFYHEWHKGNDVVFGRRVKRDMPRYLEFFYKTFYRIFSKFSYIDIPLDAGDFSLIDKRAVRWLLLSPERDLFLRGLRAYVGFKQTGVDYVRPERMFGKSTNNFLRNVEWAKKGLFSYSNAPLSILTFSSLAIFLASFTAALVSGLLKIVNPTIAPKGITTILIIVLLLGSLNLFAIGLVGEYISKILTEVKNRPRLIRESIIRNGTVNSQFPDLQENLYKDM